LGRRLPETQCKRIFTGISRGKTEDAVLFCYSPGKIQDRAQTRGRRLSERILAMIVKSYDSLEQSEFVTRVNFTGRSGMYLIIIMLLEALFILHTQAAHKTQCLPQIIRLGGLSYALESDISCKCNTLGT
jgi:hypothetical protein